MRMILKITPQKLKILVIIKYGVFLHFWPFLEKLGSKSHLIIGQNSGENALYYSCILRGKNDFRGFGSGILSIGVTFCVQNHSWLSFKIIKKCRRWGGGKGWSNCDIFSVQNHAWLSDKVEGREGRSWAFVASFGIKYIVDKKYARGEGGDTFWV